MIINSKYKRLEIHNHALLIAMGEKVQLPLFKQKNKNYIILKI
jgi:hypothetical protein